MHAVLIMSVAMIASAYQGMLAMDSSVKVFLRGKVLNLNTCSHLYIIFYTKDIDECEVEGRCVNSDCLNNNGSYTCGDCYPGFFKKVPHDPQTPCCKIPVKVLHQCHVLFAIDCSDGNVRLNNSMGPSLSEREGQVQICHNNVYGVVCANHWDLLDAGVVCRQLGYNFTGMIIILKHISN